MMSSPQSSPKQVELSVRYKAIEEHLRKLQGEVLTIADALALPSEQSKAVKDLIKNAFSQRITLVRKIFDARIEVRSVSGTDQGNPV